MATLTADYISRAETWLFITTLVYFLMNGAQLFETAVIVPKWTADPPDSLQIFKGKHALDFKTFWIAIHSVHEITFMAAIGFCWQLTAIRNTLLILFAIHFAVRVWTIAFFAPVIINFQKIANGEKGNTADLQQRARQWRNLNYLRVAVFLAVSLALLPLCVQLMGMR